MLLIGSLIDSSWSQDYINSINGSKGNPETECLSFHNAKSLLQSPLGYTENTYGYGLFPSTFIYFKKKKVAGLKKWPPVYSLRGSDLYYQLGSGRHMGSQSLV